MSSLSSPAVPGRPERVPVTLVSGWFGAGKTTLAHRVLLDAPDGAAHPPMLIESGFVTSSDDPHRAILTEEDVVELSGDADTVTAVQTILGDADLRRSAYIDSLIAVVDAEAAALRLADGGPLLPTSISSDQVSVADAVVITRRERLTPRALDAVAWGLRGLNPSATLRFDIPEPGVLVGLGSYDACQVERRLRAARFAATLPSERTLVSTTFGVTGLLDPDALQRWIERLHQDHGSDLLQLHGLFAVAGDDRRVIASGARSVLELTAGSPWHDEDPVSRLSVVGRGLDLPDLAVSLSEAVGA
ncbi:MAG: GTP-binding protein [Acidimicrobiales bacterium]